MHSKLVKMFLSKYACMIANDGYVLTKKKPQQFAGAIIDALSSI
jgi:hypothetical protein